MVSEAAASLRQLPVFLEHTWLIPLFPLAGAAAMLFFGRRLTKRAIDTICVGFVFLAFLFSLGAFFELLDLPPEHRVAEKILFEWVPAGAYHTHSGATKSFVADWGFLLDPLSAVMILIVTGVGFLIHLYSTAYMAHEGGYYRFFGYMNLFMFAMLTLVLANNLLFLFVGWEGVGLCSYLLIGFYFVKKTAADAGKKAFIVNRVGDAGFLLGILLTSALLGTIRFSEIGPAIGAGNFVIGAPLMTSIALLFFVGATGKSAQIPLYVWLPDAMEGPTPVSALIHAATMVTAGVFMLARTNIIFQLSPMAMAAVAAIGVVTALFAATMGVLQTDIKRVLAYSTISQLGYMFLGCGVGAFAAGIFHLMTHAFFKALLFLGAGSVIHALSGEQDMRKMGALWGKIRTTYFTMLAATLAIAGIPPLAGFFSKDEILAKAFQRSPLLWAIGWATAGLTAFYMFRLLFLTFHGTSRVSHEVEHHIHESPSPMTVPLMILALLCVFGGWIGIGGRFEKFLAPVMTAPFPENSRSAGEAAMAPHASAEYMLMLAAIGVAIAGIWLASFLYIKRTELPDKIARGAGYLYDLVSHKYYVDEIYDAMFVNRTKDLGMVLGEFDARVIDGWGVNGSGWLTRFISNLSIWWDTWIVDGSVRFGSRVIWLFSYPARIVQTGLVQSYVLLFILGLAGFLGYYFFHLQHLTP